MDGRPHGFSWSSIVDSMSLHECIERFLRIELFKWNPACCGAAAGSNCDVVVVVMVVGVAVVLLLAATVVLSLWLWSLVLQW